MYSSSNEAIALSDVIKSKMSTKESAINKVTFKYDIMNDECQMFLNIINDLNIFVYDINLVDEYE